MDENTRKEVKQFTEELIRWIDDDKTDPDLVHKLAITPIKGSREIFKQKER